VRSPDGSDMAVIATARDVTDATVALSLLQQRTSRRTDPVNRPIEKANYLLAHEQLRNARRRHLKALRMDRE
jgi:hypothetical protein